MIRALLLMGILLLPGCDLTKSKSESSTSNLEQADKKKVFAFSRGSDPRSLDPQKQLDSVSAMFIQSLYDTLLEYHYLKRPYQLVPSLLEKMPEQSKDGLTYTFTLKKHIHFIDDPCFESGKGRQVTADDAIYTIQRFADSRVNNLSWFFLEGTIKGLDEFRAKTAKGSVDYTKNPVEGLVKTGSHTFQIHLKQKNPLLLYSFASSVLSIVPKEAVEKYGENFARKPVGTGPFKLKEYRKKQTMVLTKNEMYFQNYPQEGEPEDKENGLLASAGAKLPLVDEVHVPFIPESQPNMLKFKKGELAWIGLDRDNFVKMAEKDAKGQFKLKGEAAKNYNLYLEPSLDASYLVINLKDKLFKDNKHLRKAIAYALDIEKQIELLRNGRAKKLYSIVPIAIAGSQKDTGNFGYDFNLQNAKEHLKLAGYENGKGLPTISLTLQGSSVAYKNLFEFYRNNLAKVGITLKADYKTWPSYLKSTERGDFQIANAAWAADYPDAENFFQLLYGKNKNQNNGSFFNDEFDRLYEQTRFMENGPERYKKFKRMAQILQEEVPVVFTSNSLATGLIQKWVKNFKRNIMMDRPFKFFDIDEKHKAKMMM